MILTDVLITSLPILCVCVCFFHFRLRNKISALLTGRAKSLDVSFGINCCYINAAREMFNSSTNIFAFERFK